MRDIRTVAVGKRTWTADLPLLAGGTTTSGVLYPAAGVRGSLIGSYYHLSERPSEIVDTQV